MKRIDLTGKTFGKITVLSFAYIKKSNAVWNCVCSCGKHSEIRGSSLTTGGTRSCISCSKLKHGNSKYRTKEYEAWTGIKDRCFNKNDDSFKNYGDRGVTVCDRWVKSFNLFLNDMGKAPSRSHSIDRIDNSGNYEPGNCRWATRSEQNNNRRNNINVTITGKTQSLKQWCQELNINYRMAYERIFKLKWPIGKALNYSSFDHQSLTTRRK